MHVLVRSEKIMSLEQERKIVSKARVEKTDDGRITVLYVQGTPYERGYQHGVLLRKQVEDNLVSIYEKALDKFYFQELFAEAYERSRAYIPMEYTDEMHGLAHGSRLPLHVIHHMHILPSIGEWGGKKRVGKIIKKMMKGKSLEEMDLGTSCSNITVSGSATSGGKMYSVRILDWGLHRISKLHEFPLILVGRPDNGYAYCNISWVGFLGCISGMNEHGITIGEMGYTDPPNETLYGLPMPFLLREVMLKSKNLSDVRKVLSEAPGTNSFAFLMSDGKTKEAQLYIKDKDRFLAFDTGVYVADNEKKFPAIPDTCYAGAYDDKLHDSIQEYHGKITPRTLIKNIIPKVVMKTNFQNVIYVPEDLKFWVSNAINKETLASDSPYTMFDLKKALESFPAK
jgi:hypothetical protein